MQAFNHTEDTIPRFYRVDDAKVAWRVADDEAVVLHADSSAYFGLNRVGTLLWAELAKQPMTQDELVERARALFPGTPGSLPSEVTSFLGALQAQALIVPESQRGVGQVPLEEHSLSGVPTGWESPSLEGFGELEKLILSGE